MNMTNRASTRTLCDVFSNMRDTLKTLNFSYLSGLIEEGQYRAERMENALEAYGSGYMGLNEMEEDRVKLKKEIAKLKLEKSKLNKENL